MASAEVTDMVEQFVALPLPVLCDLAIGPIVRLVASGDALDRSSLPTLVEACWRAVTT